MVQVRGHELEHMILSVKIVGWALAPGPAVSQHPCQPLVLLSCTAQASVWLRGQVLASDYLWSHRLT